MRYLALVVVLMTLGGSAQAAGQAAANRQLTKAIVGTGGEKTEFSSSRAHGISSSYTDRQPEILKTTPHKRGSTLRIFRISNSGPKQVRRITELEGGRLMVSELSGGGRKDDAYTAKYDVTGGVIHMKIDYPRGAHTSFDYNPATGAVSAAGREWTRIAKGLTPARALHEYHNEVEAQADDD